MFAVEIKADAWLLYSVASFRLSRTKPVDPQKSVNEDSVGAEDQDFEIFFDPMPLGYI